jgi:hypothetical protein
MAAARKPKAEAEPLVRQEEDGRLVAAVALVIEREDLGPGAGTLIAAGDPIPAGLAELPRRPA